MYINTHQRPSKKRKKIRCFFLFTRGGGGEVVGKEEKNKNVKAQNSKLEIAKNKNLAKYYFKEMSLLTPCIGFFYPLLSAWNARIQI